MSEYTLFGESYELREIPEGQVDSYAIKGVLVDIQPSGKFVGYITMDDGSIVECYNPKPTAIIIGIIAAILVVVVGVIIYFLFLQPKDVVIPGNDGVPVTIKQGDDNNIVSYNGFTSLKNDSIDINFQNGDYACTITVSGDGIESQSVHLEPGEFIASIPVTYTTDNGLVAATLTIITDTSTSNQEFVIEIPENNTPNSPENVLDDYWKGEFIYEPTY